MLLYHKDMNLFLRVFFCLQMLSITDLDFFSFKSQIKDLCISLEFYCDRELVTCCVFKNSTQISVTEARSTLENFC